MKLAASVLVGFGFALAGCGLGDELSGDGDAPPAPPPPPASCNIELRVDPPLPVADPSTRIRVTATVLGNSVVTRFGWSVSLDTADVAFAFAQDNPDEIEFQAPRAGVYHIEIDLDGTNLLCDSVALDIPVRAPGAKVSRVRLRV
ncbi:MAG: hypothetical protein H7138_00960, partial [Myxococcales bacterium]|nr:hypothetical protein [Myxococcales bacterium]